MSITTSRTDITSASDVPTNSSTRDVETTTLEDSPTASMTSVMMSTPEPKHDKFMYYVLAGVGGFVVLLLIGIMIAFVVMSQRRRRRNVAIMNSKSSQRDNLLPLDNSRLNGVHNSLYGPDASSDDDTILPFQLPSIPSSGQPDGGRSPSNQTSNVNASPASVRKKSEQQERSTLEIVNEEQVVYVNDSGPGNSFAHASVDKVQEGVSSFMIGKKTDNLKQPLSVPSANLHSHKSKKNLSSTSFNTESDLTKLRAPPKPNNLKSSKSFSAVHQNRQDQDGENLNHNDYINCENLKVNLPVSKSVTKLAGCKDTQPISHVSVVGTHNRSSVKKSSSTRRPSSSEKPTLEQNHATSNQGAKPKSYEEQNHTTSNQGAKPKAYDISVQITNVRNPRTTKDLINRPHTEHTYLNIKNPVLLKTDKPLKSINAYEPFASSNKIQKAIGFDDTKPFNLQKRKESEPKSQTRSIENQRNSSDYESPDGTMQRNTLSDENYEVPDSFETKRQKFEQAEKEKSLKTKKPLRKHGQSKTLAGNEKLSADGDYLKMSGKGQLPAEDEDADYLTPDSMLPNATQDDMYVRMGHLEEDDEYVHMDGGKEKQERENAKQMDYVRMSNDLGTNISKEQDGVKMARKRGASLPFDDMSKGQDLPMASPPPCGLGLTSGYINYDNKPMYVNCVD